MTETSHTTRPRLLIEEWLPIAEIGEEAACERRSRWVAVPGDPPSLPDEPNLKKEGNE